MEKVSREAADRCERERALYGHDFHRHSLQGICSSLFERWVRKVGFLCSVISTVGVTVQYTWKTAGVLLVSKVHLSENWCIYFLRREEAQYRGHTAVFSCQSQIICKNLLNIPIFPPPKTPILTPTRAFCTSDNGTCGHSSLISKSLSEQSR